MEPAEAPRGTETILLVEPEPEVRALASFMLAKVGYRVFDARNAADACRIFEEQCPAVDLLLTEAPMSKMNGHELAQTLCARHPKLKVLYLADAEYERLARSAAAAKGLIFLSRPFTMRTLSAKVRQVLDEPQAYTTAGRT